MLQRIQSTYLLVVTLLSSVLLFSPIAILSNAENDYTLKSFGLFEVGTKTATMSTLPLAILIGIFTLVTLVSIFLYKKRMLQIRLNFFNMVLQLGYVALLFFYLITLKNDLEAHYTFKIAAIFPVVSVILTYLAIRAIGKDEALVRSIDRIR